MNNTITLTIKLCDEDRARFDNILEALQALAGGKAPIVNTEAVKATEKAAEPAESPKEQPKPATPKEVQPEAPKAQEAPKTDAPEVTTAELQSKVVQLVGAGKKDATRAIIQEYAKSVGEIPAEKRAEVMARLKELEG